MSDTLCVVATRAFFQAHVPAGVGPAGACSPHEVQVAARAGGRAVTACRKLGSFAHGKLLLAQYKPRGSSLLVGLLFIRADGSTALRRFPAKKDDESCWRVDDDCIFDLRAYNVPLVLDGSGEPLLLGLWDGEENQDIELLAPHGDKLEIVATSSRYWAP